VTGAVFLDVAMTVWHDGLVFKLRESKVPLAPDPLLPGKLLLQSKNQRHSVGTSVHQGSVLSPLLYAFTADIPKTQNTTLARYADDTAIMTRSKQPRLATAYLQEAANVLETWVRRWRIEVNPEKSPPDYTPTSRT
jgi:hypothetical protein